ncbi:MAG: Magnesium transport protein CorA [Smithella sp. PtaU1.Bin162]|nr:MAG: Magnesium transport protein CorA [Smithella sp. PtaU1.Bin162]
MNPVHLKRSKKSGLSPGSLVHIGNTYAEKSKIIFTRYRENIFLEKEINALTSVRVEKDAPEITWISVDGLQNTELMEELGNVFSLHPLVLEDILNTNQRPKMEDYGDYLYIVLRNFNGHGNGTLTSEQISIILGRNFVLSFREKESAIFEPVKERLAGNKGRIRKSGADYLVHALIDSIVDNYFIVLENMEEKIDVLENDIVKKTTPVMLQAIHDLRRELIILRKSLWPLREAINSLERSESQLINESTGFYFKDISDHVITVIESVENFRDMLASMLDIYLSSVNIKLNEVMKVLAIIATIFMPLTFIAGVYGMNFKHMPELEWHWGYFVVLGVMLTVALYMIHYFRKKKWF